MAALLSQNPNPDEMAQLWQIARDAICGLFTDAETSPPQLDQYPARLTRPGACFVTLEVNGQLQGCLGSLVAHTPLVLDVYQKARASACEDQRFAPLTSSQLDALSIEVSVLSEPELLEVRSEEALLAYLAEHRVGVILSDQMHRGVFLPQVWESLPEPADFVSHLKRKAGWRSDDWPPGIEVRVFTVTSIRRML
ncbi:AmmeMemoRadiSam system protein A [Vibrio mangrovi]|uniref:AmmeMemoRadiSam system protein A n=1 Tax=Vibrio mangrovi TaxID=474394 RepID=A0A1Y6IT26_9VIBR|nr:AmmeMemoRadiSam system protein A [Vibrio mangrovi]MDW6004541.1 AmmeMemoRadiSam system protein A [Vibrio mangrovi]SMS00829.1 hypothetical protein VIM7927_02100 [Vibrio mangrovi]